MSVGWIARVSGVSPSRLFQSYRSYVRVPGVAGACGFDHDSKRWKCGQRRNIPPGESSLDRTAIPMPRRVSEYAIWMAPGPLPMTTTG